MLKKYADDIRNKMDEKGKILSDHKKRIDDLEDENIKLLKKDLNKMKEEIKNKIIEIPQMLQWLEMHLNYITTDKKIII